MQARTRNNDLIILKREEGGMCWVVGSADDAYCCLLTIIFMCKAERGTKMML